MTDQMMQQDKQAETSQVKIASGLNVLLGLWLLVAPFILAYSGLAAALWNDLIVGFVVLILAGIRIRQPQRNKALSWTNLVLGLWLIGAPFILQYSGTAAAMWNDVIVGLGVASFGTWSALVNPD